MTQLKRGRKKSVPITIDSTVRQKIKSFKERLLEMASYEDETSAFDAETIRILMNEIDEYDRNIVLAYYAAADLSPTKLGKLLGLNTGTATSIVKKTLNKIKKLNNANRTPNNNPRISIDN